MFAVWETNQFGEFAVALSGWSLLSSIYSLPVLPSSLLHATSFGETWLYYEWFNFPSAAEIDVN